MNDYVVLDILLGLIVALFAAIGLWRGAAKEVVVTAGIFTGAAIASSWAAPWGNDLADLIDVRPDVARLVVAATALLAATLLLGYGGSALVGGAEIGLSGRVVGAALAAVNGLLLLHYCLDFVERFLTDEGAHRALNQSDVSRVLLRHFGWLLIGVAGLATMWIVVGLLFTRRRAFAPIVAVAGGSDAVMATYHEPTRRQRPAQLPRGADGGKYEPIARGYNLDSERYTADAPSIGQTIPFPPVDTATLAHGDRGVPGADIYTGEEWNRRAPVARLSGTPEGVPARLRMNGQGPPDRETPSDVSHSSNEGSSTPAETGANGYTPMTDTSTLSWVRRSAHPEWVAAPATSPLPEGNDQRARSCRVCTGALGRDDSFCPHCGAFAG